MGEIEYIGIDFKNKSPKTIEETRKANITIDIKDISFPIGIGDEIDVVEFVKAGIVKKIELLD